MKRSLAWLWLLALVPLAFGLARLRFDVEILNLLPDKLAVAQGLKLWQQHFSNARELTITVEAASADEAEDAARSLAQLLRAQTNLVADVTWQPMWKENPAQATELVAFLWLNQPPAMLGELTQRLAPENLTNVLAETREQLATSFSPNDLARRGYDPYGLLRLPESVSSAAPAIGSGEELFASSDGTFRLIFVEAKPDLASYRACLAWLKEIRRTVNEALSNGQLPKAAQFHFTGRPAFVTEIAGGMENDMAGSASGTLATIGILFWLVHRRLLPLVWLLVLLLLILAGTTAFGGLFLGAISVVSMGFASILLGLAEDFGIVTYQELRSHPELSESELRRAVAPGIIWSAVTTAGAFLILNLSALPGLGQLGSLVAIGIVLAAVVMLYGYLPLLLRLPKGNDRTHNVLPRVSPAVGGEPNSASGTHGSTLVEAFACAPPSFIWSITIILFMVSLGLIWKHGTRFDHSPNVLKPKHSEASATLQQIKSRMGHTQEPLWVLVSGKEEMEVAQRLAEANRTLNQYASKQLIAGFTLPTTLWPQAENQIANRSAIAQLVKQRQAFRDAAISAGFTTNSLGITESLLDHWQRAATSPNVFWPTNRASQWVLDKIIARATNGFLALGLIYPSTNAMTARKFIEEWSSDMAPRGIVLTGWELLGSTVFDMVVREMPRVLIPILVLVVVSLWLAFRNLKEVALSLATLAFGGLLLGAAMDLLRWDWNLLNLMAIPLLLGMGVDFSIHIQLALRRYAGDQLAVRRSVGRALLLAGATTVAGFGSLAFSTNAGMASLGKVCALGIALALIIAVYLLPVWWKAWVETKTVKVSR